MTRNPSATLLDFLKIIYFSPCQNLINFALVQLINYATHCPHIIPIDCCVVLLDGAGDGRCLYRQPCGGILHP